MSDTVTIQYRSGTKGAFYFVVCRLCTTRTGMGPYRTEEAALSRYNQHLGSIIHVRRIGGSHVRPV